MMKIYRFFTVAVLLISANMAHSQTYEAWGVTPNGFDYDTIDVYNDTLRFAFNGIAPGGFGNARLVVYREGDFGDASEYLDAWEESTTTYLGNVPNNPMGDCAVEDSVDVVFAAMQIDSWTTGGVFEVKVLASSNVDPGVCFVSRVKVRLVYDYCAFGTPVEYASFTFSDDQVCSTDAPVVMTGSPAGGTFTGTGVTGNNFDPSGLPTGLYDITYTATDGIGCTTSETQQVKILKEPASINWLVCEGDTPVLTTGNVEYVYATDLALTDELDTTTAFTFPAVVNSPTTYYYAQYITEVWFWLDTIAATNAYVIDVDATAGDDRGGYAITDSTVYIIGDNSIVRYDLDLLQPGVPVSTTTDGLFSDLQNQTIYSLYNSVSGDMPYNWPGSFEVDAIIELDADLNPTSNIILLDNTFTLSTNSSQNGLFSGYGNVIVKSGDNDEVFHIDINSGAVTTLGIHAMNLYWGENWFDYGVAGYDGTDYKVYYRDYSSNIIEHNLTTNAITPISNFTNVSDLAGFIYHPGNNRLYFHYEGSGEFGGSFETFGYMDATHMLGNVGVAGVYGCPAPIELTFNSVDLGPDVTTCAGDVVVLEAGTQWESYTWNGDNNNWNVLPVTTTDEYILEAEDEIGCILTDTVQVTFNDCSGIEEQAGLNASIYPVPNNGSFSVAFGTELSNVQVEVMDLSGKMVFNSGLVVAASTLQVNLDEVNSGMYIVVIRADQGTQRHPITITK